VIDGSTLNLKWYNGNGSRPFADWKYTTDLQLINGFKTAAGQGESLLTCCLSWAVLVLNS
jgi:hypothetical protein